MRAHVETVHGLSAHADADGLLGWLRQESASCSEMVLLPAFNKSAKLPEGETVPVEFLPKEPGEYEFACQMGMFRGKVIVE